ncbi:hypothetical protein KEM54_005997 [Ascosphaera aggregata]|nr:hypothetical protein KEM54_005997 [Ascosphaera aggregata]
MELPNFWLSDIPAPPFEREQEAFDQLLPFLWPIPEIPPTESTAIDGCVLGQPEGNFPLDGGAIGGAMPASPADAQPKLQSTTNPKISPAPQQPLHGKESNDLLLFELYPLESTSMSSIWPIPIPGMQNTIPAQRGDEMDYQQGTALPPPLPEGFRYPKFVVIYDKQSKKRIRIKATLENVDMKEVPDSYRRESAVFPRSWRPIEGPHEGNDEDTKEWSQEVKDDQTENVDGIGGVYLNRSAETLDGDMEALPFRNQAPTSLQKRKRFAMECSDESESGDLANGQRNKQLKLDASLNTTSDMPLPELALWQHSNSCSNSAIDRTAVACAQNQDRQTDDVVEAATISDSSKQSSNGLVETRIATMDVGDGKVFRLAVPKRSARMRRNEEKLNDLAHRMSWGQSRVFANRRMLLQKALTEHLVNVRLVTAYRKKVWEVMLAAGVNAEKLAPHFEHRPGRREFFETKASIVWARDRRQESTDPESRNQKQREQDQQQFEHRSSRATSTPLSESGFAESVYGDGKFPPSNKPRRTPCASGRRAKRKQPEHHYHGSDGNRTEQFRMGSTYRHIGQAILDDAIRDHGVHEYHGLLGLPLIGGSFLSIKIWLTGPLILRLKEERVGPLLTWIKPRRPEELIHIALDGESSEAGSPPRLSRAGVDLRSLRQGAWKSRADRVTMLTPSEHFGEGGDGRQAKNPFQSSEVRENSWSTISRDGVDSTDGFWVEDNSYDGPESAHDHQNSVSHHDSVLPYVHEDFTYSASYRSSQDSHREAASHTRSGSLKRGNPFRNSSSDGRTVTDSSSPSTSCTTISTHSIAPVPPTHHVSPESISDSHFTYAALSYPPSVSQEDTETPDTVRATKTDSRPATTTLPVLDFNTGSQNSNQPVLTIHDSPLLGASRSAEPPPSLPIANQSIIQINSKAASYTFLESGFNNDDMESNVNNKSQDFSDSNNVNATLMSAGCKGKVPQASQSAQSTLQELPVHAEAERRGKINIIPEMQKIEHTCSSQSANGSEANSSRSNSAMGAAPPAAGQNDRSTRPSMRSQSTNSDERSQSRSRTSTKVNRVSPTPGGVVTSRGGLYDNPFLRLPSRVSSYQVVPVSQVDINPNDILDDGDDGFIETKRKTVLRLPVGMSGGRSNNASHSTLSNGKAPCTDSVSGSTITVPQTAVLKSTNAGENSSSGATSVDGGEKLASSANPMYNSIMAERSAWLDEDKSSRRRMRCILYGILALLVMGALAGGITGGVLAHRHHHKSSDDAVDDDFVLKRSVPILERIDHMTQHSSAQGHSNLLRSRVHDGMRDAKGIP